MKHKNHALAAWFDEAYGSERNTMSNDGKRKKNTRQRGGKAFPVQLADRTYALAKN